MATRLDRAGERRDRGRGGRPGRPRPAGWCRPRGWRETLEPATCCPRWARGRWPSSAGPTTTATRAALAAIDDPRAPAWSRPSGPSWPSWAAAARCRSGAHAVRGAETDGPAAGALTGMLARADGRVVLRHEASGRRRAGPRPARWPATCWTTPGGGDLGPAWRARRRDRLPGRRRPGRPRPAHPARRRAAGRGRRRRLRPAGRPRAARPGPGRRPSCIDVGKRPGQSGRQAEINALLVEHGGRAAGWSG